QNLLNRLWPPRPGFHRRIVGNHNYFPPIDEPDRRYDTRRRRTTVILIVSDQQTDLLLVGVFIEKEINPLPGGQLALLVLLRNLVEPATETNPGLDTAKLFGQLSQSRTFIP